MKTNFPPGEWQAVHQHRNSWQVISDSPHIPGKTHTVCEINGPWEPAAYAASAALISTAPEMFHECMDTLAELELIDRKLLWPHQRVRIKRLKKLRDKALGKKLKRNKGQSAESDVQLAKAAPQLLKACQAALKAFQAGKCHMDDYSELYSALREAGHDVQ